MRAELFQFQHKYFQRFANGRCAFFSALIWWFWIWSWLAIYIRYIVWYICSIFLRRAFYFKFWKMRRDDLCSPRVTIPSTNSIELFFVQLEWKNAAQTIPQQLLFMKIANIHGICFFVISSTLHALFKHMFEHFFIHLSGKMLRTFRFCYEI